MSFVNLNLTEFEKKPKQLYEKQRVFVNIAARGLHAPLHVHVNNIQTAVSVVFHMKFIFLFMKQVLTILQ